MEDCSLLLHFGMKAKQKACPVASIKHAVATNSNLHFLQEKTVYRHKTKKKKKRICKASNTTLKHLVVIRLPLTLGRSLDI